MATAPENFSDLSFGRRLRMAREEAGYGQGELADLARISRDSLMDYEFNRTDPSAQVLRSLVEVLRLRLPWMTADWLLFGRASVYPADRATPPYRRGKPAVASRHLRAVVPDPPGDPEDNDDQNPAERRVLSSSAPAKALSPKAVAPQPIAVAPVTPEVKTSSGRGARRPSPAGQRRR